MLTSLAAILALVLGGVLLVAALYLATRPAARGSRFGWAVIAGLALAVLGLAAAPRSDTSGGFPAAVMQLAVTALAAVLGALSAAPGGSQAPPSRLGHSARVVAWLALVGLPPTYGFHARVALLNAYLAAGWGWLVALGLVATGALLVPALWEARAPVAGSPRGLRAAIVLLLIAVIIFLGLYPYPATFGPAAIPPAG